MRIFLTVMVMAMIAAPAVAALPEGDWKDHVAKSLAAVKAL